MLDQWKIKCLIPDLPAASEVLPYLERMDAARWYSNFGPLVTEFEFAMSKFLKAKTAVSGTAINKDLNVISFSSATTALELMLRASGLPAGARILTPALTFSATAASISITGHKPVFCDVDPLTWDLTPDMARAILDHTPIDAILPVAIYGYPIDMDAWAAFQRDTGIPVFVDAAAALGNQVVNPDIPVCFSLHATKPFGVGEGGLLVTGDPILAKRARDLSNFAFQDGTSREVGTNAKLAEVLAAYGLAQLARFEAVQVRRKAVLSYYIKSFGLAAFHPKTATHIPGTLLLDIDKVDGKPNLHATNNRLDAAAIQTRKWYFPPLDEHPAFRGAEVVTASDGGRLPVIESLKQRLIGLPFHAFLSAGDVELVASIVQNKQAVA